MMPEVAADMVPMAGSGAEPVLRLANVQAWYGESHALHGVDLEIARHEVVTLLGRNGAGKSTTMKSIIGMLPTRSGSIVFEGRETIGLKSYEIGRLGIAYCPEERGIFSTLSVEENLRLPPVVKPGGMSQEEVLTLFGNLHNRLRTQGTKLSGGEQQMLAIGRILRTGATTLLLDEPAEGLAPAVVQEIGRVIGRLRERGVTILLVEQNLRFASRVADRHYVIENGRIIDHLYGREVHKNLPRLEKHLGI